MNIRKKMLMSLALVVFAQSAQVSCAVNYDIEESFLTAITSRLSASVDNFVFSRPGAYVTLACALVAYTCWYSSQKQYAAKHIADAKGYLKESGTVHAWETKLYPTEGSVYRAFHNNEQDLFDAIDEHLGADILCQCEEYNRTKSMYLIIDNELKELAKHISNLSKNDLERVALWLEGFSLSAIENRTVSDENELEAYITSHIAYRGLPSGKYFIEKYLPNAKNWLCAMVCNGSNWTIPFRPLRLAKSFIWPFEGEASQVAWDLIKSYKRLQIIRKMLPNVKPSLNPANRRTTGGCIATHCLHFQQDKSKKVDVNVNVHPQNHGL